MKGPDKDKLLPDGKKRDVKLDATQEAHSPNKNLNSGSGKAPDDLASPVISEGGSDGKLSEHGDKKKEKEAEKEKEKKEEIKKSLSKEELEKQEEKDANYKRKVMEEVNNMARKMSAEEIEDEKKAVDKKNDKTKKPKSAFSPILKVMPKSDTDHKSRSESRKKKKKSKIRDEINGTKNSESTAKDEENNSHERSRRKSPLKDDHRRRVGDENDEIILNMLRESRERDKDRSGPRHIRAPAFDELEHPRNRKKEPHELVRGGRSEQRKSPIKGGSSLRTARSLRKKPSQPSNPRNDKTAPLGSTTLPMQSTSEATKAYISSRRRSQLIIIILSLCLFASLVVVIIQTAFITGKCGLKT